MKKNAIIPSVNFHLWQPCNMRCKFCFAGFQDVKQSILPKGHLPEDEALKIVRKLAEYGFEKITFAGGEPTLCPWLSKLFAVAKGYGLTTMVVSNGSGITNEFLMRNRLSLDWIALSVDSLDFLTNNAIGRVLRGKPVYKSDYYKLVERIKSYGYGLKINTVVNALNYEEIMCDFIDYSKPKRWKIFQVLPVFGQNDKCVADLEITDSQFQEFVNHHSILKGQVDLITETNDQMYSSYVMVDPAGRFFDNACCMHTYSKPILEVGVETALMEVSFDLDKFVKREGLYDWNLKHSEK